MGGEGKTKKYGSEPRRAPSKSRRSNVSEHMAGSTLGKRLLSFRRVRQLARDSGFYDRLDDSIRNTEQAGIRDTASLPSFLLYCLS